MKITQLKEKLEQITDVLYREQTNEGIGKMAQVIPLLAQFAEGIDNAEAQMRLLKDGLSPVLEAMEEKDATLLADVISYELIPILEEYAE